MPWLKIQIMEPKTWTRVRAAFDLQFQITGGFRLNKHAEKNSFELTKLQIKSAI